MDIDKVAVGRRIQAIRQELGLTLHEFGIKIDNADRSIVSRWERGVSLPSNERLRTIADLGNTTVSELLYGPIENSVLNIINSYLNNHEGLGLSSGSKENITKDTLNQVLKNPMITVLYGESEAKNLFDSFIFDEIKSAILRVLNKTDFTNEGVIRFTEIELNELKENLNSYKDRVDKDLFQKIVNTLDASYSEINSLRKEFLDQ